jgi:hypothetical protein
MMGIVLCLAVSVAQQQPPVVIHFDSALTEAMGQPPKLTVDLYRRTVLGTLHSFVPEGDSLKPRLLSALSTLSGQSAELGMTAAALIPFHDPATVGPLLDRASRDNLSPFIKDAVTGAAAAVLSMGDAANGELATLRGVADSARATSVGHVYAWRLRRLYDAEHARVPPNPDYCEAMLDESLYIIGVLDLRDLKVLEPVMDSTGSCAIGNVLVALSYTSNHDFIPAARSRDAVMSAISRARQWWHAYIREHPDGDWRPAARAGFRDPGSRALLNALNDTSRVTRFNALRLLNDIYGTHADLDPVFGFGFYSPGVFYAPEDTAANGASLRAYWRRRLERR